MLIAVRVRLDWRTPKTRRFANERFIDMLPERLRIHEHFIIKTRRQEPRQMRVDRTYIKLETGPVVLTAGGQPVEHFSCCDPLIGLEPAHLTQMYQTVRLFCPRGDYATRPVVFKRPSNQHLIIGQKRRGQRIALIAIHVGTVKGELQALGTVNQAATGGKTCAHEKSLHPQPGRLAEIASVRALGGVRLCAGYVPNTSSVTVQRAA